MLRLYSGLWSRSTSISFDFLLNLSISRNVTDQQMPMWKRHMIAAPSISVHWGLIRPPIINSTPSDQGLYLR